MSGPELRPYRSADAAEVVALWQRSVGERFPLREEVLRASVEGDPDHRPDDALVARAGSRIVGFGYIGMVRTMEPETSEQRGGAWLQAVVVDPSARRRGLGRAIAARLVGEAAREGIDRIACGGGFFYLWPGLPADLPDAEPFARALGFGVGGRLWDLRGDLGDLAGVAEAEATVVGEGMRVAPGSGADRSDLLDFIFREFGGEWWHDIRWFLDRGGDPEDVVVLRDGSDAIVGFARIHTPASRPVGWPRYWTAGLVPATGGLGPIGIAAGLRGRGLGRALLTLALGRLRDRGVTDVVIDATTLLAFYGQLGFEPWMEFHEAEGTVGDVLVRCREEGRDRPDETDGGLG